MQLTIHRVTEKFKEHEMERKPQKLSNKSKKCGKPEILKK